MNVEIKYDHHQKRTKHTIRRTNFFIGNTRKIYRFSQKGNINHNTNKPEKNM